MFRSKAAVIAALAVFSTLVLALVVFSGSIDFSPSSNAAPPSKYTLEISKPTTMSKCGRCHDSLDAWENPGLIFNHPAHLKRGFACKACHVVFAHQADGSIVKPTMDICYDCHSLRHAEKGLVAGEECSLCHPTDFNLKPANHTNEFVDKTHPEWALKDMKYCLMCHRRPFCQTCHSDEGIMSANHEEKQMWQGEHGKQEEGTAGCNICHAQKYCDDCHKTTLPHDQTWVEVHRDAPAEAMANCTMCHKRDEYCSDCHHAGVGGGLLVQRNCIKCHPDYLKSLFDIQKKSLAVHKAHFELTQTKPYKCGVCHDKEQTKGVGCFSFDLCKMCHGKMRLGKPIAKWDVNSGELCMRCHQGQPGQTPVRSPF